MTQHQHANATTTPEMRAFIRESDLPTAVLARLLKVSDATVRKWRQRDNSENISNAPKKLNTTLSPAQEYVVVELRKRLLLSLDELLEVCQTFVNDDVSRAGLQRCLKRHGVSRLSHVKTGLNELVNLDDGHVMQQVSVPIENTQDHHSLQADVNPASMKAVLGDEEVVTVEVHELPHFEGEEHQRRLLVASDPESKWVYVDIYDGNEKEAASRYMSHVLTKAPYHIRKILAGNYQDFLSRFRLVDESEKGKPLE